MPDYAPLIERLQRAYEAPGPHDAELFDAAAAIEALMADVERLKEDLVQTVWAAVDHDDFPHELYERILAIAHYDPEDGTRQEAERQMKIALARLREDKTENATLRAERDAAREALREILRTYSVWVKDSESTDHAVNEARRVLEGTRE